MYTAAQTFCMNSILQTPLNTGAFYPAGGATSSTTTAGDNVVTANFNTSTAPGSVPLHTAIVDLILLDVNGHPVPTGTPAASMTCEAWWTDAPVWGPTGIFPIQTQYTLSSSSNGGLPQLDIIVVYDISGSMDDQTPVRFVNRYWSVPGITTQSTSMQTSPNAGAAGNGTLAWNLQVNNSTYAPGNGYPPSWITPNTPSTVQPGALYNLLNLGGVGTYYGTALNCCPPENLDLASYQGAGANGVSFLWSETQPAGTPAYRFSYLGGLRSNGNVTTFKTTTMPEAGMPPGNCRSDLRLTNPNYTNETYPSGQWAGYTGTNSLPSYQDSSGGFTDLIVDMGWNPNGLSQNAVYPWSGTNGTYSAPPSKSYPNAAVAVEAARGNLESNGVLCSAYGYPTDTTLTKVPSQLSGLSLGGYFNDYWAYVLNNASPINQGRAALYNFYNTMNVSSNCHLGLICFSDTPGTSSTSTSTYTNNIDTSYSYGGTGTFLNPGLSVSTGDSQATDYNNCIAAITGTTTPAFPQTWGGDPLTTNTPVVPQGATDISDSLASALFCLSNGTTPAPTYPLSPAGSSRSTAKKAIVLFTDGVPNVPGGQTAATTAAEAEGNIAGGSSVNIPIYTIGLAQNANIISLESNLLGATASPGIAFDSGNNAIFEQITNASSLETAFQTIARSLCELQGVN